MTTEVRVPTLNVNDDKVWLVRWLVAEGAFVEADEPICELETSKAASELASPAAGFLEPVARPGSEVSVSEVIARIVDSEAELRQAQPSAAATQSSDADLTVFSQSALGLMKEHGVPRDAFVGRELVRAEDVRAWLKLRQPAVSQEKSIFVPHSPRKIEEIASLRSGQAGSLPCTFFRSLDVTGMAARLRASPDGPITLGILVVSAAVHALGAFPQFNGTADSRGIASASAIHVGIALDADSHGLKVGVLRDASHLTAQQIAEGVERLFDRYLQSRLSQEELTGATFTVSDLSSAGAGFFTPLLPRAHAAILGVGILRDGNELALSLTFDHRAGSGREAAEFLEAINQEISAFALVRSVAQCGRCGRRADESPDSSARFLFHVVTPTGQDDYLCSVCYMGW